MLFLSHFLTIRCKNSYFSAHFFIKNRDLFQKTGKQCMIGLSQPFVVDFADVDLRGLGVGVTD